MRKKMRKTMSKIALMRKMMRKIVFMRKMMSKMKISSSKVDYGTTGVIYGIQNYGIWESGITELWNYGIRNCGITSLV